MKAGSLTLSFVLHQWASLWREHVTWWDDDDDVCIMLDQHAYLNI